MQRHQAIEKLVYFSDQIRGEMPVDVTDVEENWDHEGNLEFSFKAMGLKIQGQMVTCDSQVTVQGSLPFAALPFRGAIENAVKEKIIEAIG